jgi:hypothetical protein
MAKKSVSKEQAVEDELNRLTVVIMKQKEFMEKQRIQIENLHHQAIGYDAVLDFLWTKLESR